MRALVICLTLSTYSCFIHGQILPPYFNSFENLSIDTLGWETHINIGTNDWEVGIPEGIIFSSPYSGSHAWVTDLDSALCQNSTRYLQTPFFDLSGSTEEYLISFRYRVSKPSSALFLVQYRTGISGAWASCPATNFKENFDNSGYYGNSSGSSFVYSARNLDNLLGALDSVQFRFLVTTDEVTNSNHEGWIIDDFEIRAAIRNFTAVNLGTITGVHENFVQFDFDHPTYLTNEINDGSVPIATNIYWSTDPVLDIGDTLLFTSTTTISQYYRNYFLNLDDNIPLPVNLDPGVYYLFYYLDPENLEMESDETDNIGMATIVIEQIYQTPYIQHFDSTNFGWSSSEPNVAGTFWKFGDPNTWNIENAHSGNNAWSAYKGTGTSYFDYLESPYINLSLEDSNCFCVFYQASMPLSSGFLDFWKPHLMVSGFSAPLFTTHSVYRVPLPESRITPHWDSYCFDISNYDDQTATKFRFRREWANGKVWNGVTIDDVYIGSPLPDYSIEGFKTALYSNAMNAYDTLHFYVFNAGLKNAPPSEIKFFWSVDSLYQTDDIYLGSLSISSMNDTSFYETSFTYLKQDQAVNSYYIIYIIDGDSLVNEMREYNNVGSFQIYQTPVSSLPYENDFEVETTNWRHEADLGIDNWSWAEPSGIYINQPFSGNKGWVTKLDTSISTLICESHLYTPIFDLTQLSHPIMEFNLSVTPFNLSNMLGGNLSYSTDGGASWQILNHTSLSAKRLYTEMEFDFQWGDDEENILGWKNGYFYPEAPNFVVDDNYIGRNYRDTFKVVIDLGFLQGHSNVQFRFSFANSTSSGEGLLLDDFKIIEAFSDLKLEYRKHLLVNSTDAFLKIYYNVLNYGNSHVNSVLVGIYLSEDSLFSIDDIELSSDVLQTIKPYESKFALYKSSLADISNYSIYNYLIFNIDKTNFYSESDESNNIDFYYLDMDSLNYLSYPYVNNFEAEIIEGWNWEIDGGDENGPRFRHKTILGEPTNQPSDGNWFTDPMDLLGYPSANWGYFGKFLLESPAFDLSQINSANISFDFICVGSASGGSSNTSGGNMQFSLDGGLTWQTLYNGPEPSATNWYPSGGVLTFASLDGDYGWYDVDEWTHATYNLSSLCGNSNVRLRFQFSSDYSLNAYAMHGFRLDNFTLTTSIADIEINNATDYIYSSISDINIDCHFTVQNNNNAPHSGLKTFLYWSNDSILDITDQHIYTFNHAEIDPFDIIDVNLSIERPDTIAQLTYYLFYHTDGEDMIVELNESNNIDYSTVLFDATNLSIEKSESLISIIDQREKIVLEITGEKDLMLDIKLFDCGGKLIYNSQPFLNANDIFYIPKGNISNGIYILTIQTDESTFVQKIVMQK